MAKEIFNSLNELLQKYPKKELGKAVDLTNQHYHYLTPLTRVDKKLVNTGASWACKCDCGNYIVVLGSQIINGHTTSCGCYNKTIVKEKCKEIGKKSYFKDYTKINNPYYEFLNQTNKIKSTGAVWNIKCKKCGKIYQEIPSQLVSDYRRKGNNPCLCWRNTSKGVLKIINLLKEMNINFIQEYTFDSCLSPKNKFLKFDFYLIDYDILIEYDGEQHFENNGLFGTSNSEEKLKKQKEYDIIKNNWCKNNNKKLIRIPYKDYNILNENYLKGVIYG